MLTKNSLTQLILATVGVVGLNFVVDLKSAQAAQFTFTLFGQSGQGNGSLSFTNSTLTGVGNESAKLSELPANTQFNIEYSRDIMISPGGETVSISFSEPTFYFENGSLVGINIEGSAPFSDGRQVGDLAGVVVGDVVFSAQGNTYTDNLVGTNIVYRIVIDEEGNETLEFLYSQPYFSESIGEISFDTSEPVPEPLTILGTATAISCGVIFKRKLKKTG